MTYEEMSDLLNRLEHLDCVFFYNYMEEERKSLHSLYKRLTLEYKKNTSIKDDIEMLISKYSKLIKEYDDKHQIRLEEYIKSR